MKISQKGLDLIKSFEGCRLATYKCPSGVPTIGYGHTGKDVKMGMTITLSKAEEMLRNDLIKYENRVMKYYDIYKFNQNQFDALVSFCFNVGSIDQLTALGTRSLNVISVKMLLYNKSRGKVLTGLVRRRKSEQKLFLS